MSHCICEGGADETYYEDVSPAHFDGETYAEKCKECSSLVEMH